MRDDFVAFSTKRGGDPALMYQRLQTARWRSRRTPFTGFFSNVLTEYGIAHGIISVAVVRQIQHGGKPARPRRKP